MKNKIVAIVFSVLMSVSILLSVAPITAFASSNMEETTDTEGRLPVYIMDGSGNSAYLDVITKDGNLFARAESFAKKFGYILGYTDDYVQFYQQEQYDDAFRWTFLSSFKINGRDVWTYDGYEKEDYEAPVKTIKKGDSVWIPLQFALKIMGREIVISNGIILVSEPHETFGTVIHRTRGENLQFWRAAAEINKEVEDSGDTTTSIRVKTLAMDTGSGSSWLLKAAADLPRSNTVSLDNVSELTTFLVSNLAPENNALYRTYFELLSMYAGQNAFNIADEALDGFLFESELAESTLAEGKKIIENFADRFLENNCDTLKHNDAFKAAYVGLTGYDPIDKVWTDDTVYVDLYNTLTTYKDNSNEVFNENISYYASFFDTFMGTGMLDYVGSGISCLCVTFTSMRNENAKNLYASDMFKQYLSESENHPANSGLRKNLLQSINDYRGTIQKMRDKLQAEILTPDYGDYTDSLIDALFGDFIGSVRDTLSLQKNYKEHLEKLEELEYKEHLSSAQNYMLSKIFVSELREYVREKETLESAYLFYRTEYVSNYYLSKAMSYYAGRFDKMPSEKQRTINSLLRNVTDEESYQMAVIKSGIEYGLSPAQNRDYNKDYDDSKLIAFVENVIMSKGNSNGNINNCGFSAVSSNYRFYVTNEAWTDVYCVYMQALEKDSERVPVTNNWAHWLNTYESDGIEYLIYVDDKMDIRVYNAVTGENKEFSSGSYSNVMVAYGYVFAKEDGNLVKIAITPDASAGEKTNIIRGVGDCVVYEEDTIIYSDASGNVYKTDFAAEDRTDLGINSSSFDISLGNLYYSDNNDNGTIHAKNLLTGADIKMASVENTYCIIIYGGLIYFKIADGENSRLVYSVVPFVDKAIPRVFAWKGGDFDWFDSDTGDEHAKSFRNAGRVFNISNGKIINEGMHWRLKEYPLAGVNFGAVLGYVVYKVSQLFYAIF